MSSAIYPNFKVDNEAIRSLALCIHAFSNMITERYSEKFHQREELQSLNLKRVLAEYFGDNLLKVAMSEGNKCLICCENLAFKARNLNLVGKPRLKSQSLNQTGKVLSVHLCPRRRNLVKFQNAFQHLRRKGPNSLNRHSNQEAF
ncbi:hypothetical protein AVEN_233882-1 [Araneus ventricosus]|uniref:Uncharacterized protein n=1 Tax=Araneus ventricosus TaxID=182803 RepID=A0A4Y2HZ63_ARAVE|nr:hypothetical protein AVEN_233882-1 [Araneus ventricosus]